MLRSLLPATTAAALLLALPAAAHAIPNPFPEGTNWILSGTATLDAAEPTPAGTASLGEEGLGADGRYVAFSSRSDGLSTEDDDSTSQVYVKDRQTGALTLVSRATGVAGAPADAGGCFGPALSADGTRVAFSCSDAALDPADGNGNTDVYVRDWQAASPVTTLVSRGSGLGPVGDSFSSAPSVSATGEWIAFASNVAFDAADTNDDVDVYRRRIGSGDAVQLVSRVPGGAGGNAESDDPSISDDGQRIAFTSEATNFLAGPTDDQHVWVATPAGNSLVLASAPSLVSSYPNGPSDQPALSGDGTRVAFTSQATDLQDGDADTEQDVHTRNLTTSVTTHVTAGVDGPSYAPSIDADGSVVGFLSPATNVAKGDPGDAQSAFVAEAGGFELVGRRDGDGEGAVSAINALALDASGQVAAVDASEDALTPDAEPGLGGVYVRDRAATPQTTRLASRPAGSDPFVNVGGSAELPNQSPQVVSADGGRAVLTRVRRQERELLVRDTRTGATVLAGRADGPDGAIDRLASDGVISADGTRVAWSTDAPLDPVLDGDDKSDVYLRDLAANRTFLVSRADGADGPKGTGFSYSPALDADGSRVAFQSSAQDLGDGAAFGKVQMHVRDLAAGRTSLASARDGAAPIGGNASASGRPAISADGTLVAFTSDATDLGDGDADPQDDVHLRDLAAGTTRLVSGTPGGTAGNGFSTAPSMSADGRRIAFSSTATNLVEDFPGSGNVYVRDLGTNALEMAGRAGGAAGTPAASGSRSPMLSADGRVLAFSSQAQDLGVPVDSGARQLYRRDLATGQTTLAARRADGTPVDEGVELGALSADGACVVFATEDPRMLTVPVSPDYEQVYLRALAPGCVPAPAQAPQPGAPGTGTASSPATTPPAAALRDRTAPVITRASLTRKRFRVAKGRTALAARTAAGSTLRFTLSEAARLTVTVERARPGRKSGKACKAVAKRPRRGACTAYRLDGTLVRKLVKRGAGRLAFTGRLGRKALAPGVHRLTLRATDAAGNRSRPVALRLTIVRR